MSYEKDVFAGLVTSASAATALALKHPNFKVQDEGVDVAATGLTTIVNFVGAGISASFTGATLTVTSVAGAGSGEGSVSISTMITTALAPYLTSASAALSTYVTSSSLATALAPYLTSASAALSTYVLSSSLATALAPYATSASVVTALAPYLTSASAALSTYVLSSSLATALAPYLTSASAALSTYVLSSSLATALAPYATSASVVTSLATKGVDRLGSASNVAGTAVQLKVNGTWSSYRSLDIDYRGKGAATTTRLILFLYTDGGTTPFMTYSFAVNTSATA
ncbi:MAG: hypothetical protein ABIO88_04630, partial [Burkholderiaceae bacterium]